MQRIDSISGINFQAAQPAVERREAPPQDPADLFKQAGPGGGVPGDDGMRLAGQAPSLESTAPVPEAPSLVGNADMGYIAGEKPPAPPQGGVRDLFYHHIDWSGWSGKEPLKAGVDVLTGEHLSSGRAFSIDTWHGVLRGAPRDGTVTLVWGPDMPNQQRAEGIFQRPAGSGIWLSSDAHLEGVLYTGRTDEIPPELTEAVASLNKSRAEFGLPAVDLLPWSVFQNAWR